MCIAILTNAHPEYALILANNRDEYLHRPTAPAEWWSEPDAFILGGRDLHREEQGTWLGITKQGRIACLTNFREGGQAKVQGKRSRGAIVNAYLKTKPDSNETTEEAAREIIGDGVDNIGGFSLLFGRLQNLKRGAKSASGESGLAIVSNRSTDVQSVAWVFQQPGETHALSNAHFTDRTWPKVLSGEQKVEAAIKQSASARESADMLVERLLAVLSLNNMGEVPPGTPWTSLMREVTTTILVPTLGGRTEKESSQSNSTEERAPTGTATTGVYATQKQTVILVNHSGKVTFVERTLFDRQANAVRVGDGEVKFEYQIEGW